MDAEQALKMDSFILLSFINTKLRDEFSSLELLCEDFNWPKEEIESKLKTIDYTYNKITNQFVSL